MFREPTGGASRSCGLMKLPSEQASERRMAVSIIPLGFPAAPDIALQVVGKVQLIDSQY